MQLRPRRPSLKRRPLRRPRRQRRRRRRYPRRCPPKSAAASTSSLAPQPISIDSRCSCRFPRLRVRDRSRWCLTPKVPDRTHVYWARQGPWTVASSAMKTTANRRLISGYTVAIRGRMAGRCVSHIRREAGALHQHQPDHQDAARIGSRNFAIRRGFRQCRNCAGRDRAAYFYNSDNSMEVIYGGGGGTIFATVVDLRNPEVDAILPIPLQWGFRARPRFPYNRRRTVNGPNPSAPITIIFQQLGGRYAVDVTLPRHGQFSGLLPGASTDLKAPTRPVRKLPHNA